MSEGTGEIRREVVKHSSAIQIQNNITLLQRKAWNVLLYHAYDNLLEKDEYDISVRELRNVLEYNSNDEEYLKEIIRALVSCTVEWNILGKDGNIQWGVAALLADAQIENGICVYSYGAQLRKRLHNPTMYARLSLSMQNRFDSKYAQALWELCVDYLGSGREAGETSYVETDDFRKLMGMPVGSYAGMKKLNQKVIKPAIAEINKVSDLRVTVDYQRKGRKVTALKFKIRRVAMLPVADGRQHNLFPDLEDMPVVLKMLKDAGLADSDAWEVWQKGFEFVNVDVRPMPEDDDGQAAFLLYVREKIHLLKLRRESKGGVANPSGFLLQALRLNYGNPQFEQERAAKGKAEKRQRLMALEKQREKLKEELDNALKALSDEVVRIDGMAEKAIAALKAEGGLAFERWYEPELSALENYRGHHGLAVSMGKWLEGQFPVQFGEVRRKFEKSLGQVEKEIKVLEAEGISTKYLSKF